MTERGVTPAVLARLVERGNTQRCGAGPSYQPCIRAVPEEAPGRSSPAQVPSPRLGRDIHVLSRTERTAACLAIYNPRVFEIQDQRLLSPVPAPHPLQGHPAMLGRPLPPLPGTIAIAERLQLSDIIPVIEVPDPEDKLGSTTKMVPVPWVGDLLLLLDPLLPYAVNWNVKRERHAFDAKSSLSNRQLARRLKKQRRDVGRVQIEAAFYADAQIPTIEVTLDKFDAHLEHNLVRLAYQQCAPRTLCGSIEEDFIAELRQSMGRQIAPLEVFTSFAQRHGLGFDAMNNALLRAVWTRQLRVDLYAPILNDHPLRAERMDVLEQFSSWFDPA